MKWINTKEKHKEKERKVLLLFMPTHACICSMHVSAQTVLFGVICTRSVFQALWYIAPRGLESQGIMQHRTDGSDYASLKMMILQPVTWRVHAVIILRNIDLGWPIRCLTAVLRMSPANSSIHARRKIYDADVNHMHINLEIKKTIYTKPSIYIKFGLHYHHFHDKIFKTRPHLPIFPQYF